MMRQIQPHGGNLHDLLIPAEQVTSCLGADELISWTLTHRQVCDLELLMNGAFSPLQGFMGQQDYQSVLEKLRLADGTLWPIPVCLAVTHEFSKQLLLNQRIALRDNEGTLLALMDISDIWQPDKRVEAQTVYQTETLKHPGVCQLFDDGTDYLGGRIIGVKTPEHYDFRRIRFSPTDIRAQFKKLGWGSVVGFQTRNPMHQAHLQLTLNAMQSVEANLLLHPIDAAPPGDVSHYTRIRCYEAIKSYYPSHSVLLSLALVNFKWVSMPGSPC